MTRPLCVELFCGTFGWSQGWLELGGEAVGFDIEHEAHHGPVPQNAHLVLQDVRTLHGKQFRNADLILASPPCQEFSYRAMPWKRARELGPPELGMELFHACFRIQREACEAAGRYIPMVVENVKGAQKYVGRARWHFGSYYLWGDVPALMPVVLREGVKVPGLGAGWKHPDDPRHTPGLAFNGHAERQIKNQGGSWFAVSHIKVPHSRGDALRRPDAGEGTKCGGDWFGKGQSSPMRMGSSKSPARKAASALIARIPERLSRHIAETYYPTDAACVA